MRRVPNGDIEFLGRQDNQVKMRGFRVELDEIAAILRSHVGITDAVVVVHGNEPTDKRLIAYCTGPLDERPTKTTYGHFREVNCPIIWCLRLSNFLSVFQSRQMGRSIAEPCNLAHHQQGRLGGRVSHREPIRRG